MKPKDKERLARNRGILVQSLEVTQILAYMRQEGALSKKDEDLVLQDPRRRQRAIRLLDMLEQKKSEVYFTFLDALEDHYPHLFLLLREWEDDEDDLFEDEWTTLRRARKFLIKEIDAAAIIDDLRDLEIVDSEERAVIMEAGDAERRTETMLDILETKSGNTYDMFLDALNKVYPHIYLLLTDTDDDLLDSFAKADLSMSQQGIG